VWAAVIILLGSWTGWREVKAAARSGGRKAAWKLFLLYAVGVGLCVAQALRVPLPNPMDAIVTLFKPVNEFVFRNLR